jgi:carboxyl-terminal processing protease
MTQAQRSFWNAFWLAMALVCAAAAANAQDFRSRSARDNSDFGAHPDEALLDDTQPSNRTATRGGDSSRTSVPSLRTRLLQEQILDEDTFTRPSTPREKTTVKTRRYEVEDVPPLPRDDVSQERLPARKPRETAPAPIRDLSPRDLAPPRELGRVAPAIETEPERQPAPVPTAREKIERRYQDPRTVRLLNQLTAQTAQALFIEVAQMIDARHIQPTTYATRIDNALTHLSLALETSSFQQATRLQADDRSIELLQRTLSEWKQRVAVKDLNDAVTVLNRVHQLFEETVRVQPGTIGLEFVHAELDTLDQFSMLIPPEKAGGPNVGMKDSVVGIGVEVEVHPQGLKVMKVLPGGPAAEVSMKRGDILTAVDGHNLEGLELNQSVDYILGQPGVPLKLNLMRDGRRGDVTLVRRKIAIQNLVVRMEDDSRKVGYIKLEQFGDSSVRDLDAALMSLHNQGMKSLVLDLRGNPGGLLTAAIAISDRFLPSGTIVSTKGRTPADNTQEQAQYAQTWKVPLVVLIDRNSASASEILAAAIQENGRGIVVGERSYGKGTVQTLFPLQSAPAGLRLTTAKFYSPDGREMSGSGVTPDVKVMATVGNDATDDAVIAKAVALTADPKLIEMARKFTRTGAAPHVFRITT